MSDARNEPDDLVVLAADKQMESALQGLLPRHHSLGIREIGWETYRHPNKDPGCRKEAHSFLRSFQGDFRHAMVLFDYEGCGRADSQSVQALQEDVEENLRRSGWEEGHARCVVIDPELEVWVWSDSPEVDRCLEWSDRPEQVQDWLRTQDVWPQNASKPPNPKHAMDTALEEIRQPRSSSMFEALAENVSLRRCEDAAFQHFCQILREWFSPSP